MPTRAARQNGEGIGREGGSAWLCILQRALGTQGRVRGGRGGAREGQPQPRLRLCAALGWTPRALACAYVDGLMPRPQLRELQQPLRDSAVQQVVRRRIGAQRIERLRQERLEAFARVRCRLAPSSSSSLGSILRPAGVVQRRWRRAAP